MDAQETYSRAIEAFNRDDPAGFAALYADDAVVYDPQYPQPLVGREAILQDAVDLRRSLPDARFTIRMVLQRDESAAVEYDLGGTHLGPLSLPDGELEPTGLHVDLPGGAFSRFDSEGRVAEERRYYDVAGMFNQLGILQVGAHAG